MSLDNRSNLLSLNTIANLTFDSENDSNTAYSAAVDFTAVAIGLVGAGLNILLLWVLAWNDSVDKKCSIIYKSLAAIDAINCFIIPFVYMHLHGHGYQLDIECNNRILYLIFGATVSIPYLLLILISVARIMIFKHRMFYTMKFTVGFAKTLSLFCLSVSVVVEAGVWFGYWLANGAKDELTFLVGLLKFQGIFIVITATMAILLVLGSAVTIHKMLGSLTLESMQLASVDHLVAELRGARKIFLLFFWSIFIWSSYPMAFATSFFLCGPYYNSTASYCQPMQGKAFSDPKISYAIFLLFLCCLSITNSLILLSQKSFKYTLQHVCFCFSDAGESTVLIEEENREKGGGQPPVSPGPRDISGKGSQTVSVMGTEIN